MSGKKPSGININLLNTFFTVLTAFVFCFILIISANVNRRFNAVKDAIDKFIVCEQSSKMIKEGANNLTEQARLFVISQDPKYAEAYLEEVDVARSQENALHNLEKVCSEKDLALQRLKVALTQAESLTNMELYAIRLGYEAMGVGDMPERILAIQLSAADSALTTEELRTTAINNLFGEGYLLYKTRINENCNLTVSNIEQQIKDELSINADELGENISRLRMLFLALLVVNVLIFIAFGYLVIFPLEKFKRAIEQDEKLTVIGSLEFKNLAQSYNAIYELKLQNQRILLRKADYDALTGILNRRAFDQICQSSAEKKQNIALLLIDLDNFKYINDNYGHAGGDTVLKELARTLSEAFRKEDYIARIGGDEFAAILPDFNPEAANIIKSKIAAVNESLSHMKDGIKPVSISVGAAFSTVGFNDELYKNADKALYVVKEKGKRGCEVYVGA